ncbi:MAG: tetratricopeptide repeat-containing sensor histidine kinase, partial [Flavobacteriaceae bacterium]
MLKLSLSFLCVLFFFYTTQAQNKFPNNVTTNSEKAIYFNVLAKKQSIVDSSVYFTEKALLFSEKSNNDSLRIATYYLQAYYDYYASKYKSALNRSLKLDSLLKVKKNNYYLINNKILISQSYIYLNQPSKALDYGNQALDNSINILDSTLIADSYYHLGYLYNTNDMNKQARKYFIKSIEVLDLIHANEKDKYRTYTGLVRVSENYNEAVFYLNKTYEIIKDGDDKYKIAYFYVNKGDILNRWEEGLSESITASKIGLRISDSINQTQLAKVALLNISRGSIDLHNYELAIKPLNRLLNMDYVNTQTRFLILEALSRAHEGLNNYQKAFKYEREITQLKDSIYSIRESSTFADFDAKFKSSEKDKEIVKQQLEIAQQKSNRNKWIFGAIGFLLVGFSIFQWRNNQQKRKKLLAEAKYLNEQEINELRTKFLGNIAHEIRTPLTLISGNLNLALENYDNKDKAIQNIKTALSNSKKVVEDANEILELLKFEKDKTTIKLNEVYLTEILKRIYFSFASLAEMKKIKLNFKSIIPENILVKIDVEKVEKILNNLISNAVKYSPSNATIIFNAALENNTLTVKVTDFGQGIHFNETEKIFQRFYQSSQSNAVGGIGIGLSLAKEFAELLNGNLSVESELKKGSTFIFTLPVEIVNKNISHQNKEVIDNKEQKEGKTSIPTDTETLQSNISISNNYTKPNILIVEDNPEMCAYIVEILS